jgi:hypothetical protein
VLYLEGRRSAQALLLSMKAMLTSREAAAAAFERLEGIALVHPQSYAAGIRAVVAEVQELLADLPQQVKQEGV